MVNQPVKLNRMKYSLSKRGIVSFLFSKLAFLIFGIIISGAFFYFLFIQQNIQQLNGLASDADSIANVIGAVSASPFNTSINYYIGINGILMFENNNFTIISGNMSISHPLYIQINGYSKNFSFNNCLHIEKYGGLIAVSAGQEPCQ